jgi:hypothetical protein
MEFLVLGLLAAVLVAGILAWRWCQRERIDRLRDQTRLRAVEGQIAALRAMLRINVAEHDVRRQMHDRFMQANGTVRGGHTTAPWER